MTWGSAARRLFEVGSRLADVLEHWLLDNAVLAVWDGPTRAPLPVRPVRPIELDQEQLILHLRLTRAR